LSLNRAEDGSSRGLKFQPPLQRTFTPSMSAKFTNGLDKSKSEQLKNVVQSPGSVVDFMIPSVQVYEK